jgi:hypothetical protein
VDLRRAKAFRSAEAEASQTTVAEMTQAPAGS